MAPETTPAHTLTLPVSTAPAGHGPDDLPGSVTVYVDPVLYQRIKAAQEYCRAHGIEHLEIDLPDAVWSELGPEVLQEYIDQELAEDERLTESDFPVTDSHLLITAHHCLVHGDAGPLISTRVFSDALDIGALDREIGEHFRALGRRDALHRAATPTPHPRDPGPGL